MLALFIRSEKLLMMIQLYYPTTILQENNSLPL